MADTITFKAPRVLDTGESVEGPVEVSNARPLPVRPRAVALVPKGYQQIAALAAATGLTVPEGATIALIVPEAQAVRWRDDGAAPTASAGQPLAAGAELYYDVNLGAIAFIEQTAGAKLNVTYYAVAA